MTKTMPTRMVLVLVGLLAAVACGNGGGSDHDDDAGTNAGGTVGTGGSAGNAGAGGTTANGGAGGSGGVECSPTLLGQTCANANETCAYTGHQCRCEQGIWICSLCPDTAPNTGASCADVTTVCTYAGTNQCTCGGVPLPLWTCTGS